MASFFMPLISTASSIYWNIPSVTGRAVGSQPVLPDQPASPCEYCIYPKNTYLAGRQAQARTIAPGYGRHYGKQGKSEWLQRLARAIGGRAILKGICWHKFTRRSFFP